MFNKLPIQCLNNNTSPKSISNNYLSLIRGLIFQKVPVIRISILQNYKIWTSRPTTVAKTVVKINLLVLVVMIDDRCEIYGRLLGRSDIVGAALERPKQHPHAQTAMVVAVSTSLDDHMSALAQDHG